MPPSPESNLTEQLISFVSLARRMKSDSLEIVSVPGEVHVNFVEAGVGVGMSLPPEVAGGLYEFVSAQAKESGMLDLAALGGKGRFVLESFVRLENPGVRIHLKHAPQSSL